MEPKRSVATALSLLALFTYGFRLDHGPLQPWDEAIYADAARNMLDGHILIMQLSGHSHKLGAGVFLEKPPLMPLLQAISMGILGESPAAARLPSFLAFIGCVILVVYIATDLFDPVAGLVAGLLLIFSNPATASHGPLYGSTDVVLTLSGSLAVWLWLRYQREEDQNPRRLYGAAAALAIAVLIKGVAAIPFGLIALPALAWRPHTLRSREFWQATGVFLIIAFPWYLYVFVVAGDTFVQQFFMEQVVQRATGEFGIEQDALLPFMRYPYFLRGPEYIGTGVAGIIVLGLGAASLQSLRSRVLSIPVPVLYLIFWGAIFPVLYAMVGGNHGWYVWPSIVPASIIGGWATRTLIDSNVAGELKTSYAHPDE